MSKFWSPLVHDLTPYSPGEQPKLLNLIKLNTNENPYGPSLKVVEALKGEAGDSLRLYPDPDATRLKTALARYYSLVPEQVYVGNGSDEVLAQAFVALLKHAQPVLFPDITYSFYPSFCKLFGVPYVTVPLNDAFEICIRDYARPNGGIIFPNPNAPTGRLLPLTDIEELLKQNTESVVAVDEAYIDFGGESASVLINRYPNLLVIQTLSKSRSLAGLRVGFALGHPELIEALERVKNSYNSYPMDRFALAGAVAAFEDRTHFEQNREKIIRTRDVLVKNLSALGFEVIPSAANFIFVSHSETNAAEIARRLRDVSIIVRHFRMPRIENYLRITVGTAEECSILVKALAGILG
jgi:histidinol-phosphate aminotransferase